MSEKSKKNGLPYYKRYPRDFIEGTIGMSFELKAAYSLVLDLIYMQGGNLPDDARYISGLLGLSVRKWNSIREDLIERDKIQVSGKFLTNYRAVIELESLRSLQDKQSENRSRPNKNKDLQSPRSDHTEPEPEPDISSLTRTNNIIDLCPKVPAPKQEEPEPDPFTEFYEAYPRKVGRGKARQAYAKAVKDGASHREIMAGLARYQKHINLNDIEMQYRCHPATWLNQERWDDELEVEAEVELTPEQKEIAEIRARAAERDRLKEEAHHGV